MLFWQATDQYERRVTGNADRKKADLKVGAETRAVLYVNIPQLNSPQKCDLTRKRTEAIGKFTSQWMLELSMRIWCTNWMLIIKWDTYWFGLLCRTYVFMNILAGVPGCLTVTVWGWWAGVGHGVLLLHDLNKVKTHSLLLFSLTAHLSRAVSRFAVLSVHMHSLSSTHSVCLQL